MKRNRGTWLALLIAVAVLCWWLAIDGPDTADDAVAVAASTPPPAAPPTSPSPAPVVPIAPAPPRSATATEPPAVPSPPPSAAAAPRPVDTGGFFEAFEARFAQDPRDSAATEVENHLRKLLRAPGRPAGLLQSVLCRQSICKIEINWVPQYDLAYRSVLDELMGDRPKSLVTRAGAPDATGSARIEAYWVRAVATPAE